MRFSEVNIPYSAGVCDALRRMVDSAKVPHAIMFHEDDGGGAMNLVLSFLQYLYCHDRHDGDSCGECPCCNKISKMIHPDVHFVFPVNKDNSAAWASEFRSLVMENPYFTESDLNAAVASETKSSIISVAESKSILSELSLSALEGGYRSVVIYLPEKMNQEASNRLLKMIEEPPALTEFLLVTHAPDKVISTIRSRCQLIRVLPGTSSISRTGAGEEEFGQIFSSLMTSLLSRDLTSVLEAGETMAELPSRENLRAFCKFVSDRLRDIFLIQQGVGADTFPGELRSWAASLRKTFPRMALQEMDRADLYIQRNVNIKLLCTDLVSRLYTMI